MTCDYKSRRDRRQHPPEASDPQTALTRPPEPGKRLQRNEGALSLVSAKVRELAIEAILTEGFHGDLRFRIEVVDGDLMLFEDSHGQRLKLK